MVFMAELVNTALEAIVDHVAPEFHALAKVAKDCAAGAVFLTAFFAVFVGLLVLGARGCWRGWLGEGGQAHRPARWCGWPLPHARCSSQMCWCRG